jgi:hypothetical protein
MEGLCGRLRQTQMWNLGGRGRVWGEGLYSAEPGLGLRARATRAGPGRMRWSLWGPSQDPSFPHNYF